MSERPDWDRQFAETEDERNERLRTRRLKKLTETTSAYDTENKVEPTLFCQDCPPIGYPTDRTRCLPCPRRLVYDKDRRTIVRASEPAKTGMFILHNCWKCKDGELPCAQGSPRQCEFPHARND